jgi:autotransporter-associated beta strand protein
VNVKLKIVSLKNIRAIVLLVLAAWWFGGSTASAQRQMERLGRGMIALRNTTTQVYVGWRLLGNDPGDVGFNLYRSANGGVGVKLNGLPLTNTTDYVDVPANLATTAYTYSVKPVLNGVEVPDVWANPLAPPATLPANAPVQPSLYLRVPLQTTPDGDLDVKFCWVGDLDGDGEYDFVVDRQPPGETRQFLEAYKRDGTMLWRMDLGFNSTNHYNIEPGASSVSIGHGDNLTVFDLDGDGKAEVILRTANGVVFGDGQTLTAPNNNVQYLSIINGMTGAEMARATLPNLNLSDGPMNGHMGVYYPDGQRPSVLWAAKNRAADNSFHGNMSVWDYRNGQLTQRFFYSSDVTGDYTAEAHQIRLGDPDNDGKDEFVDIGFTLDDNGTQLFNVPEVIHGDRFHMGDLDPDRPGLETFVIQQNNPSGLATAYYDAGTGKMIKKWYAGSVVDVGRGDATDFDPAFKGSELVSTRPGIYDSKANKIYANSFFPAEAIWWDADLSREFLQANETVRISKVTAGSLGYFDLIDKNTDAPGSHLAYGGRPAFWGDILGDWREEIISVENGNTALRIYTTKYPATNRLYTLMHNPQYRDETTTKGYVQASMVDYFLGNGMTPPPPPPMVDSKLVWRGNAGNVWDVGTTSWFTNALWISNTIPVAYNSGDSVLFDLTGSNNTAIALSGTLTPGDVTVYAPKDYTFDGSAGSLSGGMKLTKVGKGKLTLSGTNTFTGATTVWDGALVVNGDLQQSPVTVWGGAWGGALAGGETGGRVAGAGRFSQLVKIRYRGAITPGAGMGSAGTLTFGNGLVLEDGSSVALDLSDVPGGVNNDLVTVNGNLTLQGVNTFFIHKLNATLPPGVYPLINYSGALVGNANSLKVLGLEGIPVTITNSPGQIALVVKSVRSPATLTWTGGQNGNVWDLATSANWLNGATKDIFVPQDFVRFDNTGSSNLTVNVNDSLLAANIIVDSSANYTLTGNGAIIGGGGLTKTNSGTLVINTINNNYTGRNVIAGGTVEVAELDGIGFPSPLGSQLNPSPTNLVLSGNATLRITGESFTDRGMTLSAGTNSIEITSGATQVTVAAAVVGSGTLQKLGGGILALTASNSYSGGTIIQAGAIVLGGVNGAGNRYGLGSGPVTFINGTLSYLDLQNNYTYSPNFIVPTGNVGRIDCDGRSFMTGTLTGGGTLTVMTPFVRTDFSGNWSAFTGQINVISDADGGSFRVNNSAGLPNAKVSVGNLVSFQNRLGGTPTISIGELSGAQGGNLSGGTGSDGLSVNWSVGGLNTSASFAGSTYNNVGLIKVGTGTWMLSGTNISHTGQTTVNTGTLLLNGNATNATGAVTVGAAGTLGGTGIVGGNTTVNGKLSPGTGIGTLTFRGNLTFGAGSTAAVEIQKSNGTKDLANALGTITYGGTLVVTNLAGTLANGDSFKIFNAAVYAGSFNALNLPPLAGGLTWSTAALNTSGTLSVVIGTAQTPPAAPTNLVATAVSTAQINLTWTDNSTNETSFLIERSPDNSAFTQIASVGAGVTSYPDASLAAGTLYFYRVRASNSGGNSAYSEVASATTFPTSQMIKSDTTTMNTATDWSGATPSAGAVGVFNNIISAVNAAALTLGGDVNVGGLIFSNNLNGAVTVAAGNALTLGGDGINMATANQNVTFNNALSVAAPQIWNVGTSRSLTVNGTFTSVSNTVIKTGGGNLNLGTTTSDAGANIQVDSGVAQANASSGILISLNGGTFNVNAFVSNPINVLSNSVEQNVGGNRTWNGNLTGSGPLTVNASSTHTWSGNNSAYTGTITLQGGGALRLSAVNSVSASTAYIFNNGTMNANATGLFNLGSLSGSGTINGGAGQNFSIGALGGDTTFGGVIGGGCFVIKTGGGTLALTGANTYTGGTTISNGTLQIGGDGATGSSGPGNITNNATLAFSRSDAISDSNFGVISGTGALIQSGDGVLTLTNNHTYSGATLITSGTLALVGNGAIANSTNVNISAAALLEVSAHSGGGITFGSGKKLGGNGAVNGNVVVASGAKLEPGNAIGTLTFSNNLTLSPGSITTMEIISTTLAKDSLNVAGTFSRGGTLIVTNIGGASPAAGDSFQLFNAPVLTGSFSSLALPPLGPNLAWDTNSFLASGTLTVLSTLPPVFGGVQPQPGGSIRLNFTGPTGRDYELRASTNLLLSPMTLWDLLDSGTFGISPVIYDDLSATNNPQRFYRIVVP